MEYEKMAGQMHDGGAKGKMEGQKENWKGEHKNETD